MTEAVGPERPVRPAPQGGRFHPGRLQTRFLVITSLFLVVVSGAITIIFYRLSVAAVEESRFQAAYDVALSLARRLSAGVPDKPVLDRVLSEYVHDNSEIVAVAVRLDGERESEAGMHVLERAALREAYESGDTVSRVVVDDGERLWSVAVPIVREGRAIGSVGVWTSLRASELLTRETRRLALILLPASILVLVLLLSVLFHRQVQVPMEALGTAMMRAEAGERDAEAPVFTDDEIGFIAERYNRLLANVQQSQEELSTRVKQATTELQQRNLTLERLNRELYHLQRRLVRIERQSVAEHMTARVAHKIGTPLNLISGHVQLLRRARADDRVIQDKLSVIESQVEKLTATIREILDETRKTSFEMKHVDLKTLLESTRALLEPTLTARSVQMELRLGPGPVEVEGDEDRLEQVFLTLINNSLDAMPEGGRIEVSAETTANDITVRLTDNGIGIPETLLPNIFKPFFTTKEPGRGTGLGLSIVTEILSAHGADIRAESSAGEGTTFVITFPRSVSRNAS